MPFVWLSSWRGGTREVGSHRLVESDLPLLDELHEGERGPGLGQGAALVDGLGRRGLACRQVLDTDGEVGDLPFMNDPNRRTRDLVLGEELGHLSSDGAGHHPESRCLTVCFHADFGSRALVSSAHSRPKR
jgi:hypothetical protein